MVLFRAICPVCTPRGTMNENLNEVLFLFGFKFEQQSTLLQSVLNYLFRAISGVVLYLSFYLSVIDVIDQINLLIYSLISKSSVLLIHHILCHYHSQLNATINDLHATLKQSGICSKPGSILFTVWTLIVVLKTLVADNEYVRNVELILASTHYTSLLHLTANRILLVFVSTFELSFLTIMVAFFFNLSSLLNKLSDLNGDICRQDFQLLAARDQIEVISKIIEKRSKVNALRSKFLTPLRSVAFLIAIFSLTTAPMALGQRLRTRKELFFNVWDCLLASGHLLVAFIVAFHLLRSVLKDKYRCTKLHSMLKSQITNLTEGTFERDALQALSQELTTVRLLDYVWYFILFTVYTIVFVLRTLFVMFNLF